MGARRAIPLLSTTRGKALTRPMTAVAIRVPVHLEGPTNIPRLYVHEGARQALERRLCALSPMPITLSITDNIHNIITHSSERGVVRARIHHMFLDAPESVLSALARYVHKNDRKASALIGDYIEKNHSRILRRRPGDVSLQTKGKHHDLGVSFQRLSDKYFHGQVQALVTWGRRTTPAGHKRETIKLGSYSPYDRLIRIHPALDRRWVPRYFVEYVMFHEMLHHVMPHTRGAGRRALHPPEFCEREREFRSYERAMAWEQAHLARLLRG